MSYYTHRRKHFDSDALNFLDAASISDSNIRSAITTLVINLKNKGLWSKTIAIYPLVGGTASTHKWNLKDPRDLDAAFRLTFSGGWTHSGTGALPNGTTGYADTYLVPSTDLTQDDTHTSIYIRTNVTENAAEVASLGSTTRFRIENWSGSFSSDQYDYTTGRATGTNTDTRGYYIATRTASNIHKIFKNDSQLGATNTGSSGLITGADRSVYIGATSHSTGAVHFSTKEQALTTIGNGLSDSEASALYDIVQEFQTTLGREV